MKTRTQNRVPQWTRAQAVAFGDRLRHLREQRGLSQRELSFPGCTAAYISRVEKGERYPSVVLMRGLAARLDVSPEFLETGQEIGIVELLLQRVNEATEGVLCANFKREDGEVEVWFGYGGAAKNATGETLAGALRGALLWAKKVEALREAQSAQEAEIEEASSELLRLEALSTVTP